MYYVYVLKMVNNQLYFGFTSDLRKRIEEHRAGKVTTTRKYLPIKLVYYECYLSRKDSKRRELMLKAFGSTWSQLKKRLRDSIKESQRRG